jgi:hypothetical protein
MSVSMKPKADTNPKEKSAAAAEARAARRRLQKLMQQLQERPELLAHLEALLSVATGEASAGAMPTADEVETSVVEITRRLGRQTIVQWAQEAQARALAEYLQEHPAARVKKKDS